MKFSLWPSPHHHWDELAGLAAHAETSGWDRILMSDHFLPQSGDVVTLECWSTLSAVAALTSRVAIGSLVSCVSYRHPAVLANIAATVDSISDGRLFLGLGAGWQENEHTAYGIELLPIADRLARLAEACEVITLLGTNERTDFAGRYYALRSAPLTLRPEGGFRLIIGGGGERTTMRLAAQYGYEWNVWATPETLIRKTPILENHCRENGRDPRSLRRSVQALVYISHDEAWLKERRLRAPKSPMPSVIGTPAEIGEMMARYASAGVTDFVLPDFNLGPPERIIETMDLIMEEIAPAFRASA